MLVLGTHDSLVRARKGFFPRRRPACARTAPLMDMAASQALERIGFVKGVGVSSDEAPRRSYTLDEIGWVPWEMPPAADVYMKGLSKTR